VENQMNVKKQVFEYLAKYPEATTTDLLVAFPHATKKSLWNYSGQWKKNRGLQPSRRSNSIRQRVFSYIDSNPDATSKDLQKAFPNENRVSISNYHYQWRKVRPDRKKKKSVKNIVFSYLNHNPEATFRELRNVLPDINPSSVSAYQSIWKQTQSQKNAKQLETESPSVSSTVNRSTSSSITQTNTAGKASKELIEALKDTIETQKVAIETMSGQNALLQQNQSNLLPELDDVPSHKWQELQKFIAIFIRGIKND
jgi:hypothetical protein